MTPPRCTCGLAAFYPNEDPVTAHESAIANLSSIHLSAQMKSKREEFRSCLGKLRPGQPQAPAAALPAPDAKAEAWPPAAWLVELMIAMAMNRTETVQILRDFCAALPPRPVKPPSDAEGIAGELTQLACEWRHALGEAADQYADSLERYVVAMLKRERG